MAPPDDTPMQVGRQLAQRRDELDLTQDAVARGVGITVNAVSSTERGRSAISKGKRARWEQVLLLRPGTIGRAYRDGTDIEVLPQPEEKTYAPYADLSDRLERAIWEIPGLAEEDKIMIIDALRRRPGREGGVSRSA